MNSLNRVKNQQKRYEYDVTLKLCSIFLPSNDGGGGTVGNTDVNRALAPCLYSATTGEGQRFSLHLLAGSPSTRATDSVVVLVMMIYHSDDTTVVCSS